MSEADRIYKGLKISSKKLSTGKIIYYVREITTAPFQTITAAKAQINRWEKKQVAAEKKAKKAKAQSLHGSGFSRMHHKKIEKTLKYFEEK